MSAAPKDPSLPASYYQGLLDVLRELPPTRIEIPFTRRHWEAVRVAPKVALARGLERQLDIGLNPLFYQPSLDELTYRSWLRDNAVAYVALPDAELDESATAEAALLDAGILGLEPVWHDAHWRVWKVQDATPMVEGPAHLERLDPDSFALEVDTPSEVLVRVHYSSHWDTGGAGCIAPSPTGWTLVRPRHAGPVRVRQVLSRWAPLRPAPTDSCPGTLGAAGP
ncbi:MAG: hypothetical protein NVS3B21_31500 [Acidimicrobiales bacterium]